MSVRKSKYTESPRRFIVNGVSQPDWWPGITAPRILPIYGAQAGIRRPRWLSAESLTGDGRNMSSERFPLPRPRCRSLTGVRIIGTGSYVPASVVTNDHLHQRLGCDSDWIVKRTGILERRHALPYQATSDLCYEAGQRCIQQAGIDRKEIDFLVVATFT